MRARAEDATQVALQTERKEAELEERRVAVAETMAAEAGATGQPLPAPAVRRFQLAMSGAVPLPLPDLDGPPGRLGLSVTRPDLFPRLSDV